MGQIDSHTRAGWAGPKCWAISAAVGAILGFVLALAVPPSPAATGSGHARSSAPAAGEPLAPVVIQINPDGTRLHRRVDGSTSPVAPTTSTPAHTDPARTLEEAALAAMEQTEPASGAAPDSLHQAPPEIPLWLCAPFILLLLSIALMPFISEKFWHAHYPDFAFGLGSLVLVYYLRAFGSFGTHAMLHVGVEYYSFIALVGGLFVASGGILLDIRGRGTPLRNTLLLAVGAVLANLVGTTGASMLLIRPFLRMNRGRLRPLHVVFFIFIVSNCGGCLTPIGDPPLYLGFLKGVPFFWTLTNLWPMWLTVNGILLVMFLVYDRRVPLAPGPNIYDRRPAAPEDRAPVIAGLPALICLVLLVACVFIDPLLQRKFGIKGVPVGPTIQIILAAAAFFIAKPSIKHANQFNFGPVKEVGFLFVGIFFTMAPALEYLGSHASEVGPESPTQFYIGTGTLSAFLDNAPTYLSFLQVALGVLHLPLSPEGIQIFIASSFEVVHAPAPGGVPGFTIHFQGQVLLEAIALGAVFFGAMTYIGNGPNFMVKSIVDSSFRAGEEGETGEGIGVKMPSFLGFLMYSIILLLPVLILNWWLFVR